MITGLFGIKLAVVGSNLARKTLNLKLEFETLLLSLSNQFIHLPSDRIDSGVNLALEKIGQFAGVDRSWIVELDHAAGLASNTFEWCAAGIESGMPYVQNFPIERANWWTSRMQRLEIIHVPDVKQLPAEAVVEREILEIQGIKSVVAVPLVYGGELMGMLGFDSVRQKKTWPPEIISLLQIVGEMLSNALERKRSEQRQAEAENRYAAVVESLAEGLVIGDLNDVVLYVNPQITKLTGYSSDELCGSVAYKNLIPKEQWHKVEFGTKRRLQEKSDRYELELVRKDGERIWVEVTASPYRDSSGNVIGSIAALNDVTARKRAEDETKLYQEQFIQAQKMEALGQLAAGVAHDLNNSLAAVIGHLQLIQAVEPPASRIKDSVQLALSGCSRASSLANQLLSFSRHGQYRLERLELRHAVKEAVDFLSKAIGSGVSIDILHFDSDLYVLVDHAELQQAVTNLVLNASQAMEHGGEITIEFGSERRMDTLRYNPKASPGEFCTVAINDQGHGIAKENLIKIFDPFFTTKEDKGGTGLGLSMVYAAMQRHGGWVEVESEVGRGTSFKLLFPKSAVAGVEAPDANLAREATKLSLIPGKILIIDDEPVLADLAAQFLKLSGFKVQAYTSGRAALEWFKKNCSDVAMVILDMKMPDLSGRKCFEELRAVDPEVRVALTSGFLDDLDVSELIDLGALKFFQKPVDYPALVDWVKGALAGG
ncbi:MAG: hypothetical protein DCC75_02750 [Proteobacteria bacterium]|nr:MAG: hypothetical protein DCC75_02750 [Pseudomonadota bacterium]